jgi:hypothetical protein
MHFLRPLGPNDNIPHPNTNIENADDAEFMPSSTQSLLNLWVQLSIPAQNL